jgi:signal transduction histidine kinase
VRVTGGSQRPSYDEHMTRIRLFAWVTILATIAILLLLVRDGVQQPDAAELLFWIALLMSAELLPVSLGYETQVTMSFPITLAAAIHFHTDPAIAMLIAGLGSFDIREVRRQVPLYHALFNRAQLMLSVGAAAGVINLFRTDPFDFPIGVAAVALAAVVHVAINLGLVSLWIDVLHAVPLSEAFRNLFPRPVGGFVLSQTVLAGLGAATAAAFEEIGFFVVLFLIPLLFARLSILGARAQQELGERVRLQQGALLEATEKVFQERENERKRIAEDIHDSSLQMLAAAAYGCGNTAAFIEAGRHEMAHDAVISAREAIDDAIKGLRESLVDLRRSTVEEGGLVETIRNYAHQLSTLWGAEVRIEGGVSREPPIPVALAAFQILQEGLVNALKHSHGSTVVVKISDIDNMVHIVVEDEGPGFDPTSEVGRDHVGMRLMKERAARVGGRIEIDSRPGSGTRLEAVLPGGVGA